MAGSSLPAVTAGLQTFTLNICERLPPAIFTLAGLQEQPVS